MQVGQKLAIGYGAEYPAVERVMEKYEVVTITEIGKPGTQAWLAYDAKPGDTNIKVSSTENISVGDKIRLDIASEGHGVEWVTVKAVGTPSSVSPGRGPMPLDQAGTGLDLEEPIKYAHSANIPFANNGTGVTFEPATKYDHSSNEPVLALCFEVELKEALGSDQPIDAPVQKAGAKEAGFQGTPDMYYGGPSFANAGTITLRTAKGNVADALNYGLMVEPWVSEGFHEDSGHGLGGSVVSVYTPNTRFLMPGQTISMPDISSGRFPDGADADDNINDFKAQSHSSLAAAVGAGSTNIKVSRVNGLKPGGKLIIGNEQVTIKEVGTTGATRLMYRAAAGSSQLQVEGVQDFRAGQVIKVGNEEVKVASVVQARRQYGTAGNTLVPSIINLEAPVKASYGPGTQVAGTGITLSAPLKYAHPQGAAMTDNAPTPGAPNVY